MNTSMDAYKQEIFSAPASASSIDTMEEAIELVNKNPTVTGWLWLHQEQGGRQEVRFF